MKHAITVVVEDPGWRSRRGVVRRIERAAALAIEKSRRLKRRRALTILLSSDEKLRMLNRVFRRKNKPTNVLAFPARMNDEQYLGDVAIARGVVEREAADQGKRFSAHATHLAVHGVLHLLGYEHKRKAAAVRMERLEAKILSHVGIDDPYEARAKRP